jgi:hypothetical protein
VIEGNSSNDNVKNSSSYDQLHNSIPYSKKQFIPNIPERNKPSKKREREGGEFPPPVLEESVSKRSRETPKMPCKFFHLKGECLYKVCYFSHDPITPQQRR